jgi:hypothetical protein
MNKEVLMFYVKEKLNAETTIKVEITDENVFTCCPECGREKSVDLSEIFKGGDADLYSTKVYCSECFAKRQK